MRPKPYRLLVVAHPDDETIFFAGLVLSLRDLPWRAICLTDGNADGRGLERHQEFTAATKLLGIKTVDHWDFPDLFAIRLPLDAIAARLRTLPPPKEIYTHGPLGEYGHPHHQDCCLAVHRAFGSKAKIISPAWNCGADFTVKLTNSQFAKKAHAYGKIYGKETARFQNVLPNMPVEPFRRFSSKEVEALVGFMRREKALDAKALKDYAWTAAELPDLREKLAQRLF